MSNSRPKTWKNLVTLFNKQRTLFSLAIRWESMTLRGKMPPNRSLLLMMRRSMRKRKAATPKLAASACCQIVKALLHRFSPHLLAAGLTTSAVPTVQVNRAAQANRAAPAIQVSMHLWTQSLSISMMTRTLVRWILSYRESLTSELSGWRV